MIWGSCGQHSDRRFLVAALESRIAADGLTKAKYESLKTIWGRCVELEKAFWDMAFEAGTE